MPSAPPKPKHDHHTLKFPQGFLWGAATSAHQVEGNNYNSDWWEWEQKTQPPSNQSGIACDQYNRYEEDFDLAKSFNHNAHRLSIEWSRIEPREGEFDPAEIEHYRKVLQSLKDRGFTVMLTLHHFTNPLWLTKKGGWEKGQTIKYFNRYVEKVAGEYKDLVDLWITINEPSIYAFGCYLSGKWPPQEKSRWKAFWVLRNMAQAHKQAYNTIHSKIPNAKVGVAHNIISFDAFHHHSVREMLAQWAYDFLENHFFYKLTGIKHHDFLGINYYFNRYISFNGEARLPNLVDVEITKKDVSDLGWEIYPEGIFDVLMDLSDYHLPIFITENGLASTNDDRRARFLISYLKEIYHAIQTGVDVRGYFHWSLLDNFEWADGFTPRFGLIEVDYQTLERTPRPSAQIYAEIIQHNGIPHHLMRLIGHTVEAKEVLERAKSCKGCGINVHEQ